MNNKIKISGLALMMSFFLFTSCGDDEVTPTQFRITVENVSTPSLVDTERAGGIVPMSPPVFALYEGDNPMFQEGSKANAGTEAIAEDGGFDAMVSLLNGDTNVKSNAAVTSPGGPDNGGALFAGESVSYTFTADADDKLQFMTMFVQSNDWFYAFGDDGIDLFDDGEPVTGDITSEVVLYDAGTEADTAPGTGPDQKPVQATDNQGPAEDENVDEVSDRHSFTTPANSQVIKVTLTTI